MNPLEPLGRRSFIQAIIKSCIACFFLPGAMRKWKSLWIVEPQIGPICSDDFTEFLLRELPIYDREIVKDIAPSDGWIGHVSVGNWEPFDSTQKVLDRFRAVQPDMNRWSIKESNLYTPTYDA